MARSVQRSPQRGPGAEQLKGSRGAHEAVGFLALGWNWFHWLSENVTRCATTTSVFAGTNYRGGEYPNIFSSVLHKSREWPRRTVGGGFKHPQTSPWPRHCGWGFLFAFHGNYGAILYRLRNIATYWYKIAKLLYPTCIYHPHRGW